ncbi:hypothetical protein BKA69DRAFT_1123843 [Paraphysoderma sedebokerense]|nr:hypothetical protein BKA69DRAFT_1123843 [Paraphysoderma sedebokerense]
MLSTNGLSQRFTIPNQTQLPQQSAFHTEHPVISATNGVIHAEPNQPLKLELNPPTANYVPNLQQSVAAKPPPQPLSFVHPSFAHQHTHNIIQHLYNAYLNSSFADTAVHIPLFGKTFGFHALILSQSSFWVRTLAECDHKNSHTESGTDNHVGVDDRRYNREITVDLPEGISEESFSIAIGHLYAPIAPYHFSTENSLEILAASLIFGLPSLTHLVLDFIQSDISPTTIQRYLSLCLVPESSQELDDRLPVIERLKNIVQEYVTNLPLMCTNWSSESSISFFASSSSSPAENIPLHSNTVAASPVSYETLVDIFSLLPFQLLKSVLESDASPFPSKRTRFLFAKDVIKRRDVLRSTNPMSPSHSSPSYSSSPIPPCSTPSPLLNCSQPHSQPQSRSNSSNSLNTQTSSSLISGATLYEEIVVSLGLQMTSPSARLFHVLQKGDESVVLTFGGTSSGTSSNTGKGEGAKLMPPSYLNSNSDGGRVTLIKRGMNGKSSIVKKVWKIDG